MKRLIGLGGYALSGKDTFADHLVALGWRKTYMSYALEQALLTLDPVITSWPHRWGGHWGEVCDRLPLAGYLRYSEIHELVGYDASKLNTEVRRMLQVLGTEIGRNMLGENVWVDAAFKKVDELRAHSSVAITGIRYPNELAAIKTRGGVSVWISRPGFTPINSHTSDNALGPDDFDIVIENAGDVAALFETAHLFDSAAHHPLSEYAAVS
jgi:hypothetical protein